MVNEDAHKSDNAAANSSAQSIKEIQLLGNEAAKAIEQAQDLSALEAVRVHYLGKKAALTAILHNVAKIEAIHRPKIGQYVNQTKQQINHLIEEKLIQIKAAVLEQKLQDEKLDVTLPGRNIKLAALHPVTQIKHRITDYFVRLGFDIVSGPEIENDFYNFTALNIPKYHPARDMHDTFYFGDGRLLRTHTSPVQIHIMQQKSPPLRLIAPGRVYRCDSDATHTPMFHQVEGLLIDKDATLASLRGLLQDFFAYFFKKELALRFRASYFPFTEPSAEVDLQCTACLGKGCRLCKFTGWLEILGCGMVHPNVLKAVNIDPSSYQGWAFGMGIDRLAMLYFGIDDLRMMFENELTFLEQF